MTSEPTAEKLSRNLFCRPFTAVIVVTTATMPMMMPSVVSAPRALLAASARSAIRTDSANIISDGMPGRLLGPRPAGVGLVGALLVVDAHERPVAEILGDRAIAPAHDLLALLQPIQDLDPVVALDPGLDLVRD